MCEQLNMLYYYIVDEITTRFSIFKIRCVTRKRIPRLKMPMKMERQYDKKDTPMYTKLRWTLACPRRIRDASAYLTTELQHKIRVLLFPLPLKQVDFDRSIAEYGVRYYCIAFNECASIYGFHRSNVTGYISSRIKETTAYANWRWCYTVEDSHQPKLMNDKV